LLSDASPQNPDPVVIRTVDLCAGYGSRPVLRGVSLDVRRGDFIGVLGPNGSGKTTLVRVLSGVIPLKSGRVEILGAPVETLKPKERARRMAVVAQDGEVRFPFPCAEVVRMGRYPHQKSWQMDDPADEAVVQSAMEATDTLALAERLITDVSGGERQRVMMARALAQTTPLLLLDEATSAMDVHRKLQIFTLLEERNRTEGLTVLAVLHDVNLAAFFCRKLVFLKDGQTAFQGATEEVLTPETLASVYRTEAIVGEIPGTGRAQVAFLPPRSNGSGFEPRCGQEPMPDLAGAECCQNRSKNRVEEA
jgi:iron complex transport system ATP-binding protein